MNAQELVEYIEKHRVQLTPEYEGGWHAEAYLDMDEVQYEGYGESLLEAITVLDQQSI